MPSAAHEHTGAQRVSVSFGNPDLEYGASHDVPRFTLGAFRVCAETLYEQSTGACARAVAVRGACRQLIWRR